MATKRTTKATEETVTLEEAVTPVTGVEVTETVNVEEAVAEPIKPERKIIITKTSVPFRKLPTLLQAHVAGQMPVGTAYEIVMEVKNGAGTFYKLNNNMYITTRGNYTIQ